MADKFVGSVRGLKEIEQRLLKDMDIATARLSLVAGLKRSAQPMLGTARINARKTNKSGALAHSIGIKVTPKRKTKRFAQITISPMRGSARAYQAWVMWKLYYGRGKSAVLSSDFGSQPGDIRHGHLVERGFIHPKSGKHTRATPFLRPALDNEGPGFERTFTDGMWKEIKRRVAKK